MMIGWPELVLILAGLACLAVPVGIVVAVILLARSKPSKPEGRREDS